MKVDKLVENPQPNQVNKSMAKVEAKTADVPPPAYIPPNTKGLGNPLPKFPRESLLAGEEGVVDLDVYIDENGNVVEVRIAKKSRFQNLNKASIATAKRWKYNPGKKDGKPLAAWGRISINWRLSGTTTEEAAAPAN